MRLSTGFVVSVLFYHAILLIDFLESICLYMHSCIVKNKRKNGSLHRRHHA